MGRTDAAVVITKDIARKLPTVFLWVKRRQLVLQIVNNRCGVRRIVEFSHVEKESAGNLSR